MSITTVSNVVHNRTSRVSPENVKKIWEIIEREHYVPSMSARSLANDHSSIIGVITHLTPQNTGSTMSDPFLSVFVDSWIWGNALTLIRELFNLTKGNTIKDASRAAANVHCMLMKSLASMIDRCDYFVFLDTQNAMPEGNKTYSPWIFAELEFAALLKSPMRLNENFSSMEKLGTKLRFTPSLDFLKDFTQSQLGEFVRVIGNDCKSIRG